MYHASENSQHRTGDKALVVKWNQSRRHGALVDLSPPNKAPSLPKLKYETL